MFMIFVFLHFFYYTWISYVPYHIFSFLLKVGARRIDGLSSPMAPRVVMTTTYNATSDGRPRALFFSMLKIEC